ncbi:MAG: sigma-70 family RNA polymerase sigma factor [Pseudomonadota bacterium]
MTRNEPTADATDKALLAATAKGDLAAFERLHQRYYGRINAFALRLTRRPELAEEVAGDTLMAVWKSAESFRGEAKPSTWILGIAYRMALRACRKAKRDALHDEIDDDLPAERTGSEEVETLFQRKAIAAAMERLSPEQRATVELTYFYGYRLTEIAEITGCPVGTVKTRMFHARARLRELLKGEA